MAVVYKARDMRLNRDVALKLMHPFLANQPESAARFKREAEAVAKLRHPNIVEIYDTGQDGLTGSQFLVMELVAGPTLSAFVKENPTKIPEVGAAMMCAVCDAVAHAHAAGIIHRDIKPENILIDSDGTMKLTDFGIARVLDEERMTASGSLVGSPAHMPPEIIEGRPYGFSCDIFSLGTVFYYVLTGTLPFAGATPMAIFKAILDGRYQPPGRHNMVVSRKIDDIVARCLKTDPKERYADAGALKSDLIGVLAPLHFDNYAAILARYFAAPAAFAENAIPQIADALNAIARKQTREKETPKALENLNIVLAYCPDDPQALALLRELRQGGKTRRILTCAAISLIAAAAAAGVIVAAENGDDGRSDLTAASATAAAEDEASENARDLRAESETVPGRLPQIGDMPAVSAPSIFYALAANKGNLPALRAYFDQYPSEYADMLAKNAENPAKNSENPAKNGDNPVQNAENPAQNGENAVKNADFSEIAGEMRAQNGDARPKRGDGSANAPRPVATPKKANRDAKTSRAPDSSETRPQAAAEGRHSRAAKDAAAISPASETEIGASAPVEVVQPIFPPDGYAVIQGKRYDADSMGDIRFSLPPGTYAMTLTCRQRCIQQVQTLRIAPSDARVTREIVSLDWADAKLTVIAPDAKPVYFVAKRIDDRSGRIMHLAAHTQNAVAGFNIFGKPVVLDVYAIPQNHTLSSYETDALESAKYASARISVTPGESRIVRF